MATAQLVAAIDPVTGTIIAALLGTCGILGARMAPKTRPEAAVDRADARMKDAEAWDKLLAQALAANEALRGDITTLRERVDQAEEKADTAHEALEAERELCDAQIRGLTERITQIEATRPQRVWFRE